VAGALIANRPTKAKQVLLNLLTLEVGSSIDFAWKKENQSRR
jgi:hypothetical protein